MTNREVIIATTKKAIMDTSEYPSSKTLKYINECVRGLGIVSWLKENRPEFYREVKI